MEQLAPVTSRPQQAARIIRFHAVGAAGLSLIPTPLVDTLLITGVQLNLVRALAKLYGLAFSEEIARSILSALVGNCVTRIAWSLTKFIPVVGMVAESATSAAATYAIGRVFVQHFESGGTFLTLDPEKVKAYYARELSQGAVTSKDLEDYGGIMP